MINEQCLKVNTSINYLATTKFNVNKIVQSDMEFTIVPTNVDLNGFDEIQVVIKNIKTREEYFCPFIKGNNSITIDLSKVSHLFTDYEGSIYIVVRKEHFLYNLKPIVRNSTALKRELNYENKCLNKWFVRILDNGELLFSSIIRNSYK